MKRKGLAGPTRLEARIVDFSSSGDALAKEIKKKHATFEKPIFVFGAIPGEEVLLRILSQNTRFARAEIEKFFQKSEERLLPPCSYFGRCGGCDWQHISYEKQLFFKQEMLSRILPNALSIPLPVASPKPYQYRTRARMHFRREGKRLYLGFFARNSKTVVDISACPILRSPIENAVRFLREHLEQYLIGEGSISLLLGNQSLSMRVLCNSPLSRKRAKQILQQKNVLVPKGPFASITLVMPEGKNEHIGVSGISLWEEGPRVSSEVFSQANPEINQLLRDWIVTKIGTPNTRILELYAGAGNFTLPLLQKQANIVAVESDTAAIKWLKKNTAGACEVIKDDAKNAVRKLLAKGKTFDAILLDPPRAGALSVVQMLHKLRPKQIVYISCDPQSLSRDMQVLLKEEYLVKEIVPFDMFPQSIHLETATLFQKKSDGILS